MLKKFAIFCAVVAVTTMVALAYITARYIDKEEILRAQNEMIDLRNKNETLKVTIAELSAKQTDLNKTIEAKTAEIETHKAAIAKLEREREENQFKVRSLRTEDELEKKFAKTYPEVINAASFGITQIRDPQADISLPYYVIPAWFTETFIIEHENMLTYQAQLKEYQANEKLYGNVINLKDQVFKLESEKTAAYREGYNEAYAKYEEINKSYVELLQKPPSVELKPPSLWCSIGGGLLGLAIGAGL